MHVYMQPCMINSEMRRSNGEFQVDIWRQNSNSTSGGGNLKSDVVCDCECVHGQDFRVWIEVCVGLGVDSAADELSFDMSVPVVLYFVISSAW